MKFIERLIRNKCQPISGRVSELTGTVAVSHEKDSSPFDGPMSLRMVAETYSWQGKFAPEGKPPYPSEQELDDDTINTIYYDYVRSFELLPTAENLVKLGDFEQTLDSSWSLYNAGLTKLPEYSYTHGQALRVIPNGEVKKNIATKNENAHRISFYAKVIGDNSENTKAEIKVLNDAGRVVVKTEVTDKTFQQYQLDVPAQAGELQLVITNNSQNSLTIDTLAAVPIH